MLSQIFPQIFFFFLPLIGSQYILLCYTIHPFFLQRMLTSGTPVALYCVVAPITI